MEDINYIKEQFCKFTCPNRSKYFDESKCRKCDIVDICEKLDIGCANPDNESYCDACQIDNFIRELQDNKII